MCLHVHLAASSCIGRWRWTVALLAALCALPALVFVAPPLPLRTLLLAYDVVHLALATLLAAVSVRHVRPAVAAAAGSV